MGDFSFEALYLHIPFCAHRCAYCDFPTEAIDSTDACTQEVLDAFVAQLVVALRRAARAGLLSEVRTVYIGGGTPTVLGAARLTQLLYTLSLSLDLSDRVEVTLEANPDSFTSALARDLFALGVNRLSFGVQSFDDTRLALLGRVHDAAAAREALRVAHERFKNISLDLICGIPGQSMADWEQDLRTALATGVTHLSVYPLVIEEGTPFARAIDAGHLLPPDEDVQADFMERAAVLLGEEGFGRYEVASYARPGYESRHNQAYWQGVSYLGLGRGASSMFPAAAIESVVAASVLPGLKEAYDALTLEQTADAARLRYTVDLGGTGHLETLTAEEVAAEDLMLAMRRTAGVSAAQVAEASTRLPRLMQTLRELEAKGLLARVEESVAGDGSAMSRYAPTETGWLLGNELFGALWDCRK
jgi:oxygen-independent coproporphyrinogen III oxidase